jgi:hypothetical protein
MARGTGTGWASVVVVGALTGVALTADLLPDRVASHFGWSGGANAFAARGTYLAVVVAAGVLAPALLAVSVRLFPGALNVPHRDHWLAPERREATLAYLTAHAAWLAALLSTFVLAVHLLVVAANRRVPPQLDSRALLVVLGIFLVAMLGWVAALVHRFRRD